MFIFSALLLYADLDESFASPLASASAGVGAFFAGLISSKKIRSGGIINGLICAVMLFILIVIISAIVDKQSLTMTSLYHAVIMLLAGAIGGVLGANMSSRRRLI